MLYNITIARRIKVMLELAETAIVLVVKELGNIIQRMHPFEN